MSDQTSGDGLHVDIVVDGGRRTPLSARLLGRLAAAAAGHQNGEPIYFTADPSGGPVGDYAVEGPFTAQQAVQEVAGLPNGRRLFGPFASPPMTVPGKTPVKKITVEIEGQPPLVLEGSKFDALFWSNSAIEKFALPHYVNMLGLDFAQRVQQAFAQSDVLLMAHDPNSEPRVIFGSGELREAVLAVDQSPMLSVTRAADGATEAACTPAGRSLGAILRHLDGAVGEIVAAAHEPGVSGGRTPG